MVAAGGQQRQRLGNIVLIILGRLVDRFADIGKGRKMHDCVNGMGAEDTVKHGAIPNAALHKMRGAHGVAKAARQIVEDHHGMALVHQALDAMTANVAGAASDQDHVLHPLLRFTLENKFLFECIGVLPATLA